MLSPNWSVFVEYNYMNFGNPSVNLPGLRWAALTHCNISQHIQTIVAGVNLRFNFGGAPVGCPILIVAYAPRCAKLMLLPRRGIADAFFDADGCGTITTPQVEN